VRTLRAVSGTVFLRARCSEVPISIASLSYREGCVKVDIKARRVGAIMNAPSITVYQHGNDLTDAQAVTRSKIGILFLAANPRDTARLAIDRGARAIEQRIQLSEHREALRFTSAWAIRAGDLLRQLNQHRPTIVHFSAHGLSSGKLLLEDGHGQYDEISPAAFEALFSAMKDRVRVVVLNACHSRAQAEAIHRHIDFVIGMSAAIDDRAATELSAAFYGAIGFGRSVEQAFRQGCAALALHRSSEAQVPSLLVRPGADVSQPL
jgi:CHAT domain